MNHANAWKIACAIFLFCAVVIVAPAQTFTDLFYFPVNPGIAPSTALVQGIDGNFYGATKGESLTKQGGAPTAVPSSKLPLRGS